MYLALGRLCNHYHGVLLLRIVIHQNALNAVLVWVAGNMPQYQYNNEGCHR